LLCPLPPQFGTFHCITSTFNSFDDAVGNIIYGGNINVDHNKVGEKYANLGNLLVEKILLLWDQP